MDFDDQFDLGHLLLQERKCRTCGDLKDLIDDILERQDSLREFEKELKKHKDKITPGQVGES